MIRQEPEPLTQNEHHTDIVIIGGGLAGQIAAIACHRYGLRCIVIEKQRHNKDKVCGEGLMPRGLSILQELGLSQLPSIVSALPFRRIRYHYQGDSVCGTLPDEGGLGVRRNELDRDLTQELARYAIEVLTDEMLGLAESEQHVTVTLKSGRRVCAHWLIGADGLKSRTRSLLNLNAPHKSRAPKRFAIRQHRFLTTKQFSQLSREEVHIFVGDGYELYLTPISGERLGIACLLSEGELLKLNGDAEERLLNLCKKLLPWDVSAMRAASKAKSCGPLRQKARSVQSKRCFLVGDAAGYIDAITGEGMSLAIESSVLAVKSICEAQSKRRTLKKESKTLSPYSKRWKKMFLKHKLLTESTVFIFKHATLKRIFFTALKKNPKLLGLTLKFLKS